MDIKEIKLEKPLFYKNDVGIRFEIGPDEIPLWKDSDYKCINEEYFKVALGRAVKIFEDVFEESDRLSISYQIFSDGRMKIRKGNYIFKQIKDLGSKDLVFTERKDIYSDELHTKRECWRRVTISNLAVGEVNYINILRAMINTDFGIRKPYLPGESYFINESKGIVLNLYDDRGMDVIALDKGDLNALYKKRNNWVLEYDRERIDAIFT